MLKTGIKTKAYSAVNAAAPISPCEIERREPGAYDVFIDIKFCGICHSDIHQARNEWRNSIYPMVPGHEIAGVVARIGERVSKFKIGDRVGVGCMVDSCQECASCKGGLEQYCELGNIQTYNSIALDGKTPNYGGYSKHITVNERFVVHIPDSLPLDKAAPLLCAGITTYSPLKHWHAGPGKSVAIIGLGGLGHMGVKLASALGSEVTAISRSHNKETDAMAMGAKHYIATADAKAVEKAKGQFDLIINTVSSATDIDAHLSMLKRDGVMVLVGAPADPLPVAAFSLIPMRKALVGSTIGGIAETQEMLNFCGEHKIQSDIEVIPIDKVNEAYERLLKSDVRYRFVIDIASLG